ncbi:hypothetical protein ACIQPP_50260 [Streptomyces violaceusniger]|uniref:hypothetical protein n=1 Tax=Streptomyces violaceusniger TaxID=68280 RepID=UPI00099677FB|nr:hypothetical protein [Streptomyces hygroscopicus]
MAIANLDGVSGGMGTIWDVMAVAEADRGHGLGELLPEPQRAFRRLRGLLFFREAIAGKTFVNAISKAAKSVGKGIVNCREEGLRTER